MTVFQNKTQIKHCEKFAEWISICLIFVQYYKITCLEPAGYFIFAVKQNLARFLQEYKTVDDS